MDRLAAEVLSPAWKVVVCRKLYLGSPLYLLCILSKAWSTLATENLGRRNLRMPACLETPSPVFLSLASIQGINRTAI